MSYKVFVCCLGLLVWGNVSFAQEDGPYVFYNGNKVVVKRIVSGNGEVDSFEVANKAKHLLQVNLEGHPDWDFTVKLKDSNLIRTPVFVAATQTLVLSDIEGEFEPFRNLLLASKVIDMHYNWTFGNGRLIVAGDLFDRGKQVSQFLWLLYKLEDEAKAKGGDVNVVLGNHDVMNLSGDFRYVHPQYMANASAMNESYADLYDRDTELGRWLRSKNTIEKIGDLLVLHGGLSRMILDKQMSLEAINEITRPYYDKILPDSLKDFFNANSLFWYRGYFLEPKASQGLIDSSLAFYGCKKIIVGHDIIDHIAAIYQNKVIGVDVDEHQLSHEALLIEKDKYFRIDDKGNKTLIIN
jgi:hypothetical protein